MNKVARPARRRFLRSATAVGTTMALNSLLPTWARASQVTPAKQGGAQSAQVFDLDIREQSFNIAGGVGRAMTINDTVPGPLLKWHEGRDVILNVTNHLRESTSIHWHGILLPFEMDGVPGVSFRGIAPGETFQYRFPVRQSGTYWYHSHSGLQEQSGVYGPLVVHSAEVEPFIAERDYVVMLSDWTFEDPHDVMAKLKKMSDYYNFQQFTLAQKFDTSELSSGEAWSKKLAWDRMRMMPTDIADVTGATYTYLMNGLHPQGNWTGLFQPGERIRLRVINGSAMTYFNVRIPGLPMTVIAADGQYVQPVETDEFQIGVAETYDVIVEPQGREAYTLIAESMDRSGYAAGTLDTRAGLRAEIPALRDRALLTMVDMGMDMGAMDSRASRGMLMDSSASQAAPKSAGAPSKPANSGNDHSAHTTNMAMSASYGPVVARHGPDKHGPGNLSVAEVQRDRLGERGTGLADVDHRVLVYNDLRRFDTEYDTRSPDREIELHLTGHMERYMWSFDGKEFHEVDGPIEFVRGERVRLTLVNDTMMNHPIHLHGMWMELENGHGREIPRKHTINLMPAARVSALITADAPGRWAFHCHLLYHMDMGMFRVVRVS